MLRNNYSWDLHLCLCIILPIDSKNQWRETLIQNISWNWKTDSIYHYNQLIVFLRQSLTVSETNKHNGLNMPLQPLELSVKRLFFFVSLIQCHTNRNSYFSINFGDNLSTQRKPTPIGKLFNLSSCMSIWAYLKYNCGLNLHPFFPYKLKKITMITLFLRLMSPNLWQRK